MTANLVLPAWARQLWERHRHEAIYGGRGGAKSRTVGSALVLQGAEQTLRILCVREVQRSIKDSVKRLLDDEIERLGLGSFYESTDNEIRGINGTKFIFAGLRGNAASIKSYEGVTDCWVEEAQTVSQASIDTLIPTIRMPNSRLIWTWNPGLATDPIDALFRGESQPPDAIVTRVNWDDNPFFPDVLMAELEYDKRRDPDKYAHIWLGEYQKNSEARVFKNYRIEEFEAQFDWVRRQGADWGFSVDPSVLISCYLVGRTLYVDYEAYMVGCEIINLPELFDRVPDSRKWFTTADSARPETISHMRQHWSPKINSAIKGAKSLEEGVEFLKAYDIVVHPRCTHLIDELALYRYKVDDKTGNVLPMLEDKDNHVIDALRYACEGVRRADANKPKAASAAPPPIAFPMRARR